MNEDTILLFFSLGMLAGGIAFVRRRDLVLRSLDSMPGRPWVWLFGQDRAVFMMQRFVGPVLIVVGSALTVVLLRRLLA
ncbi:MAG: hypothetical protein ACJ8GK_10185 [Luteimonas sp.]